MTITLDAPATLVTLTLSAESFAELASIAALATRDYARPSLTGVLFEVAGGSEEATVTVTATDSYVLGRMTRTVGGDTSVNFKALVPATFLANAVKFRRAAGSTKVMSDTITLTFTLDTVTVTLEAGGSMTERLITGTYPNTAILWGETGGEVASICLDPAKVAQIAKVFPWTNKGTGIAFTFTASTKGPGPAGKPLHASAQGTDVLLMPIRVQG